MENGKNLIEHALKAIGGDPAVLAERLGIKERTLSRIQKEEIPLSDPIKAHLNTLIQGLVPRSGNFKNQFLATEDPPEYRLGLTRVPILSWAHAGEAQAYEELPKDWQESVPSTCGDPNAFALKIEGDSMQPNYQAGDILIVMPSQQPRNGCLVVAKLKSDGIVFRRFHVAPQNIIRLTAYNPIYPVYESEENFFHWIYPIHSVLKMEWKP